MKKMTGMHDDDPAGLDAEILRRIDAAGTDGLTDVDGGWVALLREWDQAIEPSDDLRWRTQRALGMPLPPEDSP